MSFTPEIIAWAKQNLDNGAAFDAVLAGVCQHLGLAVDANSKAGLEQALGLGQAPVQLPVDEGTPSSIEVAQTALPAGFDLMSALSGRIPAEKSTARPKNWEVSIEELRSRVTFRDSQPPGKKDETIRQIRPFLAPNPVAIEEIYGTLPDGAPKNFFEVPAQFEEAVKEQLMQIALSGAWDKQLLDVAAHQKAKAEESANKPERAPADTAAGEAALAELSTAVGTPAQVAPVAQVAPTIAPAMTAPALGTAPTLAAAPTLGSIPSL